MLRYGNLALLTVRSSDGAKLTDLTPLLLFVARQLSFPVVDLKYLLLLQLC
jgi:hypothetical protein